MSWWLDSRVDIYVVAANSVAASVFFLSSPGAPRREQAVDKPAPSRAAHIEENKNAKLFGENPRLEAIIEGVSFEHRWVDLTDGGRIAIAFVPRFSLCNVASTC